MTPEEIHDGASLKAWFGALPAETEAERDCVRRLAIAIAHRAAMRVLPIAVADICSNPPRNSELTALRIFRPNLISGVAAVCPTPEISGAVAAAMDTAFAAFAAAASSSDAAGDFARAAAGASAETAGAAAASVWGALRSDCLRLHAGHSLETEPLWPAPNPHEAVWSEVRRTLAAEGSGWNFWVDWYDEALAGKPQDWAGLLTEVALIPFEDWEKGADHVNALIEEIRAKYPSKSATPLANAAVADFSFDDFLREMRMVGFAEDTTHIDDPEKVHLFRQDVEEVRNEFQDFVDYAQDITSGGNQARPLSRGTEKVLDEFDLIENRGTIRAARLIRLGHRLHRMSIEPDKRAPLGDTLAEMLDSNVGLLLGLCRKHFAPSLNRLAPLGELKLGDASADAIVGDLRKALDAVAENDGAVLARMDREAQATFRDMLEEIEDIRAALDGAQSSGQIAHLRKRLAESVGAFGVTLGRYATKAAPYAEKARERVDGLIKDFKRVESLEGIWKWIKDFLEVSPPP